MSEQNNTAVNVSVLDRSYQLACPPEEVDNLQTAAKHLDAKMRDLRKRNKSSNGEKLAVVAALNITSELLQLRGGADDTAHLQELLASLNDKVQLALTPPDSPADA